MKTPTFSIDNGAGLSLTASALGGIVLSLKAPDAHGRPGDVLLGFPRPEQHHANGYMNALIGRCGNRIGGGGFALDGAFHALAQNDGAGKRTCSLHGGASGFDQKVWAVERYDAAEGPALAFSRLSPDGEENYPGNLFVRVVYTLCTPNAWRIDYLAATDKPTVVNLTQHAYFNFSGGARDVADHVVQVNASRFTEVDRALLPTGRVLPVGGTPLDLRGPVRLGDRLARAGKERLLKGVGGGFDHNFLLDRKGPGLDFAAFLADPESGRTMEVWTTEPCLQFYSGNFLDGKTPARGGRRYGKHWGVCFETQHAPDSPNRPSFPSVRLEPGETYRSTTVYAFGTLDEHEEDGCSCGCHDHDGACECGRHA